MKRYTYTWSETPDGVYLLHTQFDVNCEVYGLLLKLTRIFRDGHQVCEEKLLIEKSDRFIISRTHPDEIELIIQYPVELILSIYEIDDRAYYPTEVLFRG